MNLNKTSNKINEQIVLKNRKEVIPTLQIGSSYSAITGTLVLDTKMSVNKSDWLHITCDASKHI